MKNSQKTEGLKLQQPRATPWVTLKKTCSLKGCTKNPISHFVFNLSFVLFIFFLAIIPLSSYAENGPTQTRVQRIDQEIDSLNKKLSKLRKEAFNQEMKAQPYMFDNWKEFSEDIEHVEESERKILNIKENIQMLEDLKQSLSKEASPSQARLP